MFLLCLNPFLPFNHTIIQMKNEKLLIPFYALLMLFWYWSTLVGRNFLTHLDEEVGPSGMLSKIQGLYFFFLRDCEYLDIAKYGPANSEEYL